MTITLVRAWSALMKASSAGGGVPDRIGAMPSWSKLAQIAARISARFSPMPAVNTKASTPLSSAWYARPAARLMHKINRLPGQGALLRRGLDVAMSFEAADSAQPPSLQSWR
jgi:hypothetical protein